MNWLDKLERKFPRFGIPNITFYLVACNVVGFLLDNINPNIAYYLRFDMGLIFQGQIWRLITWVFASSGGSYLTTILFLLCAVSWGRSLEQMIGTFRTTAFVVSGLIINLIGAILYYFISALVLKLIGFPTVMLPMLGVSGIGFSVNLSAYYIILTILMEIALIFPNGVVRFWFILPLKMKWMFYITIAELAYESGRYAVLVLRMAGVNTLTVLLVISGIMPVILALVNLLVFYLAAKNHASRAQKKRQQEFKQQFRQAEPRPGSGISKHKCAVCGRTEVTNPELLFRYCSKCPGGYEYCSEHLFTHTHH